MKKEKTTVSPKENYATLKEAILRVLRDEYTAPFISRFQDDHASKRARQNLYRWMQKQGIVGVTIKVKEEVLFIQYNPLPVKEKNITFVDFDK